MDREKKQKIKEIIIFILHLTSFLTLVLILVLIDKDYNANIDNQFVEIIICLRNICNIIVGVSNELSGSINIIDAFYIIWGMSITIVLFLIESSNTYWYGITLRRIVNISLGKYFLMLESIVYVLLCPLAYVLMTFQKYLAGMFCIIYTFLIFCTIPLYVITRSSRKCIECLLSKATVNGLKERIGSREGYLQIALEKLPMTDMIKHLDYNNIADVIRLTDTLSELFCEEKDRKKPTCCWSKEILGYIQHKSVEHIVVMVWTAKIIEYSGMSTNNQRERTAYILRRLWERIVTNIENPKSAFEEKEKERLIIGYSLEIILPLLKDGSMEAKEVFHVLWLAMKKDNIRIKIAIYILLYLEYLNYVDMKRKIVAMCLDDILSIDLEWSKTYWDVDMARDFWIGWIFLKDSGDNLALSFFHDFCNDIERLCEEKYFAKTNIMRQICLRRGKYEVY